MSFSREDQLNRASWIREQPHQPLGIVQKKIGTLIGGKAARESHRQHILVKNAAHIRRFRAFSGELAHVPLAHALDQAFFVPLFAIATTAGRGVGGWHLRPDDRHANARAAGGGP